MNFKKMERWKEFTKIGKNCQKIAEWQQKSWAEKKTDVCKAMFGGIIGGNFLCRRKFWGLVTGRNPLAPKMNEKLSS